LSIQSKNQEKSTQFLKNIKRTTFEWQCLNITLSSFMLQKLWSMILSKRVTKSEWFLANEDQHTMMSSDQINAW